MTRKRAFREILKSMLSYPTISEKDWESGILKNDHVSVGDLISLSSAPASKWQISWVLEIKNNNGWTKYLLESAEDGSLCWWENVGINVYSKERVSSNPQWRWTDDMFKIQDRWFRVCMKWNDAHWVLPRSPVFNNDGSVTLDVRIRFGFSDFSNPKTFPKWKKITMKEMDQYFKECLKKEEDKKKK